MNWSKLADSVIKTCRNTFKTDNPATYTPASGAPYEIDGIFRGPSKIVDPSSGASIVSTHPTFFVRLADMVGAPDPADRLTIQGITYRVNKPEVDGEGGVELTLHKIS